MNNEIQQTLQKIYAQSNCLEKYAENEGHSAKPVPSVFHIQAAHFRAYANEIEAALAKALPIAIQGER